MTKVLLNILFSRLVHRVILQISDRCLAVLLHLFDRYTHTAGFLIHGRHARIFGQMFEQFIVQIFDQGSWPWFLFGTTNTVCSTTGTENYSFTVLPGRKQMGETTMHLKFHMIENPIYQKPRCILIMFMLFDSLSICVCACLSANSFIIFDLCWTISDGSQGGSDTVFSN